MTQGQELLLTMDREMAFDSQDLPVLKMREEIKEAILANDTVVITGETGSGKTTEIPLIILETLGLNGKVIVTQPRVIAARSVADYVAKKSGVKIGEEIGYQVRFDNNTTEGTKVNFMTEGILLKMMEGDPILSGISAVTIDEAHERNIDTDLILGMVKRIQVLRKERGIDPLKVMVSSATLEKEKFSQYYDNSPVIEVKGRTFPVKTNYLEIEKWLDDYRNCPDATPVVKDILNSGKDGDILIFVPGVKEINQTIENLTRVLSGEEQLNNIEILPLHGQLAPERQDQIFENNGKRKIVVATNVAEASITVPGVKHVIDTGLVRRMVFDPETGIGSLETLRQSQDCCDQRKGRAGRVSPGNCYRLYSEDDFESRAKFHQPEIMISDLAGVILKMRSLGIRDIESFDFVDKPQKGAIEAAIKTLKKLAAFDENEDLTDLGREMMRLPLEPHLAKMVIEAKTYGCESEVATIAAFVGLKTVFKRVKQDDFDNYRKAEMTHRKFKDRTSDFLTFLNIWKAYESSGFNSQWASNNYLNIRVLNEANEVRKQLFNLLGIKDFSLKNNSKETVAKAIAMGFSDHLVRNGSRYEYWSVNPEDIVDATFIFPGSSLFGENLPNYVTSAKVIGIRDKQYMSLVQEVRPEWIAEMVPNLVTKKAFEPTYNQLYDTVEQGFNCIWKESGVCYFNETVPVEGEVAAKILTEFLVKSNVRRFNFLTENGNIFNELDNWYNRSAGNQNFLISRDKLQDKLIEIYGKRLGQISSIKELDDALHTGLDMSLKITDFISQELLDEIRRGNPDWFTIGDKDYELDFLNHGTIKEPDFIIGIKIPFEDLFDNLKLPTEILGRPVMVELLGSGHIIEHLYTDDERILEKAREISINRQWKKWEESHEDEPIRTELPIYIELEEIELPEGFIFGKDPITGDDLVSSPAIVRESDYFSTKYYIQHFPTKKEAESHKISDIDTELKIRSTYSRYQAEITKIPIDFIRVRKTKDLISELEKARTQNSGKPRRKALIWGELVSRGLDVVDQAGITIEECERILPELKQAAVFDMVKKVENTIAVLKGVKNEMVKEYIGNDEESIKDFKRRLMRNVEKKGREITNKELEELVHDVIDEMTL